MSSPQYVSIYPKRKRQVKKNNSKLFILIFLFFLLIAVVIFLNSSISKITNIEIVGLDLLTEEKLLEEIDIYSGKYYFLVDTESIRNELLQIDLVNNVEVIKHFPGSLSINIVEQKIIAYYKDTENNWIPVLENGSLYHDSHNQEFIDKPLITVWENKELLNDLALELIKVKPFILEKISEITLNSEEDELNRLLIYTREGYRIHVMIENLSENLNLYPEIIEGISKKTSNKGDIYLIDSFRFVEFNN